MGEFNESIVNTTKRISETEILQGLKLIEKIKATADRTNKKIILTWKYDEPDVDKIMIYHAVGNDSVTLYKSISSFSKQFINDQVTINTSYSYYVKVVFNSGEESGFGEFIKVKF